MIYALQLMHVADIVRRAVQAMVREAVRDWRYGRARREFEQLDGNALRDLGMSHSEFDSYWAETHGLVEQTRVRVMGGALTPTLSRREREQRGATPREAESEQSGLCH